MSPLLNLSDADTSGFEPMPVKRYEAEVFEITMDETKNPDGKVPKGTPLIKVQYKITEEPFVNRRQFQQFTIPPDDYPEDKKKFMQGLIANFFMAVGEDEKTVKSAKFDPDFEEYKGRPVLIQVGMRPYEGVDQNIVKGVRAPIAGGSDVIL